METILSTIERLNIPTLCDGSNIDDTGDYRPGLKALKECGVRSPFIELGIGKEEIRSLSKSVSLPTWDKPAYACLLTRLQYNTPITKKAIEQIDRAEEILHEYGYRAVRVRHHDSVARIELSSDSIENFMQNRNKLEIDRRIKNLGFTFVSVELSGYNTGSLNRTINLDREQ